MWYYHDSTESWSQELFDERTDDCLEVCKTQDIMDRLLLDRTEDSKIVKGVCSLGTPADGRFFYSADKRSTEANVKAMQAAESHLDSFWGFLDDHFRNTLVGHFDSTILGKLLSKAKGLYRTLAFVPPVSKAEKHKKGKDTASPPAVFLDSSLSTINGGTTCREVCKAISKPSKKKMRKAADDDQRSPEQADVPAINANLAVSVQRIATDRTTLETFRHMFHTPTVSHTRGDLRWSDLLSALTNFGFAALQLYASVWSFKPVTVDVKQSFRFHQLHPESKIPYIIARRLGRKLNRTYGWSLETFVLKE